MLQIAPDFSDKEKELEKVRKQEASKAEKQLKKDLNEWEELFAGNASLSKSAKGLATLGDKITKLMDSSVKKQLRKGL
jgi:transposase